PIAVHGMKNFYRVARVLMPFISISPMSVLYYGSDGSEHEPKYVKYWEAADLIAGDFLFMRKYMPERVDGKILLTNTTTADNVELVRSRGAKMLITTTPRYDGRSFGTNTTEAILTAYVGEKRKLTRNEINQLINDLNIRPTVQVFDQ
ncbi:MAG: hypothetical protein JXA19_02350, partial [Anaerolineales bacterium]|nr:hypothetical protein [Anaerolineales bacterium]